MSTQIHTGCCGWSYLDENDFRDELKKKYRSKLQAYVHLFDSVEINSTFYRLPRLTTAEKWRKEADEVNPGFEFTVKAFQGITHLHRFQKKESLDSFNIVRDVAKILRARFILFQSPASFRPSEENIGNMQTFFGTIDRQGTNAVWEPRGKWYDDASLIERVCEDCKLVHCVDPFRNNPLLPGKTRTVYFRLHGFGKPSMYRYDFSDEELRNLRAKVNALEKVVNNVFVFFNNETCYRNGRTFQKMLEVKHA